MMACSKLSTSDLSRVRNEVLSAAAKWYNIGLDLGMSPDYLDTIEKANNDAQECLLKMLRQWLLAKPSWESLIAALRGPAINYSALASEIEKKYCSTTIECAERHEHPVSGHGYMVQNNHWKLELVKSFEGITSHEVSKEQLEKAKQCIEHGGTRKERYHIIEFEKLLDENQVSLLMISVCVYVPTAQVIGSQDHRLVI